MSDADKQAKKPFGLRGVLAICGLVAIAGVVAAIIFLPPSVWLQGTKPRTPLQTVALSEVSLNARVQDPWTLAASSPTNATEALGGKPFGNATNAAQHAWMLVLGQSPPKSLAQQAIQATDGQPAQGQSAQTVSGEAATASDSTNDSTKSGVAGSTGAGSTSAGNRESAEALRTVPDRLQPAALLHVPPVGPDAIGGQDFIKPGTARALAVFPIAPDAIAAWGSEVVLAFVDRPRALLVVPGAKAPPAPLPPKMTTLARYRVVERGDGWSLDGSGSGVSNFPSLPSARPVLGLAFAAPVGDGKLQTKPTLFALVGPAIDVPARAPKTELLIVQDNRWQSLGQPWVAYEKSGEPTAGPAGASTNAMVPSQLVTVPGGVALLMPGWQDALVAVLPTADAEAVENRNWLTLQEDDDWVMGQPSGPATSPATDATSGDAQTPAKRDLANPDSAQSNLAQSNLAQADSAQPGATKQNIVLTRTPRETPRLSWHRVGLPRVSGTPTQLLWAGDQIVVLMQPDEAAADTGDAGTQTPASAAAAYRLYRTAASDFVSLPPAKNGIAERHTPAWAQLSEQGAAQAPWLVGIPGSARVALWWSSEADALGGIKPQNAVQVSLATGLEISRGPLVIVPPTGGADVRFVAGVLAYLLGIVVVLLVPKPSRGAFVLPKDASMASPLRRFTAGLIDLSLAVVMGSLLAGQSPGEVVTSRVADMLFTHEGQGVLLAILGSAVIFNASLESLTGRSVGKFLLGIGVARLVPGTKTHIIAQTADEAGGDGAGKDEAGKEVPSGSASQPTGLAGIGEHTFLAPALHRSLIRNLVKWCLFPLGFVAALRPGASHLGDELAQCAVIDPSPVEDDDFEDSPP